MWRIWYADRTTIDGDGAPPHDLPGYGMQVIAQPDRTHGTGNVGYVTLKGWDWFAWRLDSHEWVGVTGDAAMWDLILHREPIVGICQGRRIPDERFRSILAEAQAWAKEVGLPSKSGYRPEERS